MVSFSTFQAGIAAVVLLAAYVQADTPANCTYEDLRGSWVFEIGPASKEGEQPDCNASTEISSQYKVQVYLTFPDVAKDDFGNSGFWTIIYNQGFEVVVGGNKYMAFSAVKGKESICNKVNPGWAHDLLGNNRRCFKGEKLGAEFKPKVAVRRQDSTLKFETSINSEDLVASINEAQDSWRATTYPQFEGLTQNDFIRMAGGKNSRVMSWPKPAPITAEQEMLRQQFPRSFDWRNVDGQNYVSPVRNQAQCGSCYAFASMAQAEARVQILTNNTQKRVFSPQDIVECSVYSQGCEGGFPYLIGGKYAEDFGLVEEKCNPYKGVDGKCSTDKSCVRNYLTDYKYIGGYYGGCNEVAMMEAIYNRGPIAVGFMVYDDFFQYKSGVYHHIFTNHPFDPFELLAHAVLVVGWGEVTGPKPDRYWIVKNSWSSSWGNEGYFWIRRGTDECGIESSASEATPIFRFH